MLCVLAPFLFVLVIQANGNEVNEWRKIKTTSPAFSFSPAQNVLAFANEGKIFVIRTDRVRFFCELFAYAN